MVWCGQQDSILLWCRRRPADADGQSTGLSHFDGFESDTLTIKKAPPKGCFFDGAGNRTRTCTSKTEEPKSTESTNSTMPAYSFVPLSFTRGGTRGGPARWVHRYQNRQACFSLTHTSIGIASYPRGYRGQPSHSPLPAVPFVPASPEPDDRND